MKVPLNWLSEYLDLALPVGQLAERLTLAGLEVAGVRVIGLPVPEGLRVKDEDSGPVWPRDKIVIGKVLAVQRQLILAGDAGGRIMFFELDNGGTHECGYYRTTGRSLIGLKSGACKSLRRNDRSRARGGRRVRADHGQTYRPRAAAGNGRRVVI